MYGRTQTSDMGQCEQQTKYMENLPCCTKRRKYHKKRKINELQGRSEKNPIVYYRFVPSPFDISSLR